MADQRIVDLVNLKVVPNFPPGEKSIGIVTILDIVASIVTIVKECPNLRKNLEKDAELVLNMFHNPSLFNKAKLYLTIRRQAKKSKTLDDVNVVVRAILQAAKSATKEDIEALCDAAAHD